MEMKNKPDTIIRLTNNHSFALCGWFDIKFGEKLISEFTITICGEKEALQFYSAVRNYRIEVKENALVLTDMRMLPIGLDREFRTYPWASEFYYYVKNKKNTEDSCVIKRIINKDIKRFDGNEIAVIDSIWNNSSKTDYLTNEQFIGLVFLAAISGNEVYQKRLLKFRNTFKISGVYAEYYHELIEMYKEWN